VGIYLTLNPRVGCHDAQRNCISNVRPAGQPFPSAAYRLAWLVQQAFKLGSTGVALKDESDLTALAVSAPALQPASLMRLPMSPRLHPGSRPKQAEKGRCVNVAT
jgi:ethanolamine ammonia-lyase small subunit